MSFNTKEYPSQIEVRPPPPSPSKQPLRQDYERDPVFQRLQFEIRAAYEEGWRAAGGDPVRSPSAQEPVGWRLAWMNSKARAFLVANGINTGKVHWK